MINIRQNQLNTPVFKAIIKVASAERSQIEMEKGFKTPSMAAAEKKLVDVSIKYSLSNIPHSTFVSCAEGRLDEALVTIPVKDCRSMPLLDVDYFIATDKEHEVLSGLKNVEKYFENNKEKPNSLDELFVEGINWNFQELKKSIENYFGFKFSLLEVENKK